MIEFNTQWHGHAIAAAAGTHFNPEIDTVIARIEGSRLLGGVTYHNFTWASISCHVAGFDSRWLTKDMLWVMFHYPFNQLGCSVILGHVPSNNTRALDFDAKLGFKELARIDGIYPDGDLVILGMRREECRWLNLKPRSIKPGAS